MKDIAKISISSLIGAVAVYFLIKKLPKGVEKPAEEEPQYYYLQLPPIFLPANIPEEIVYEAVDKLKNPKITPTIYPLGWKVEWSPIQVDLPVIGQINISPSSKQLPAISKTELTNSLNQFQPTVGKKDLLWQITFPTVRIKL